MLDHYLDTTFKTLIKVGNQKLLWMWRNQKSTISPKPGPLPKDRTEKFFPFEVTGTDSAGPIYYKTKKKIELKAYILLFSCSVTRAVHIELVSSLITTKFIKSFKRLISRRGKPKILYSDNVKTFTTGAKWLENIKIRNFTIFWVVRQSYRSSTFLKLHGGAVSLNG